MGWAEHVKELLIPAITEATDGEVAVKVYWGGIMGDDETIIEKMQKDILQGSGLSAQGVTMVCPEMVVLTLPFLFNGYDEVDYIKEKMSGRFEGLMQKNGFFLFTWTDQDFDQIYSTTVPLDRLSNFSRVKFTTWYGPTEEKMLKALGAKSVALNAPWKPCINTD